MKLLLDVYKGAAKDLRDKVEVKNHEFSSLSSLVALCLGTQDGRVVRALDFNAVTRVQIPFWPLAGVVPGKCLVQLLGHPYK